VSVAPCETFGRWHHWRTLEVVADDHARKAGHALRVMKCQRCGELSWRWAPLPDRSDAATADPTRVAAPEPTRRAPAPRPSPGGTASRPTTG